MANLEGTFSASMFEANRSVIDLRDKIFLINPSATPFLTFGSKLEGEMTGNMEFGWYEDAFLSWTDTAKSSASDSATTVYVTNPTRYMVNHVVMNQTTGEHLLVTSVVSASDYVLVTRSFGETAAATILASDNLLILGTAANEGATSGDGLITTKSYVYNYAQEMRYPYSLTERAIATSTRTGPAWTFEDKKAADEFKLMMERSLLFGERDVVIASGMKRFGTRGLKKWVSSANQFDVSGVLPEYDFDDWVRSVFRAGSGDSVSNTKILLANDHLLTVINRYSKVKQTTGVNDTSYGVNITNYRTPHGTLKMVYHRLLDDAYSTTGYGLLFDPANVSLRYFGGNGIDGHTKLHKDIQANDATLRKNEYRATVGLEVKHATTHGEILNVTG